MMQNDSSIFLIGGLCQNKHVVAPTPPPPHVGTDIRFVCHYYNDLTLADSDSNLVISGLKLVTVMDMTVNHISGSAYSRRFQKLGVLYWGSRIYL